MTPSAEPGAVFLVKVGATLRGRPFFAKMKFALQVKDKLRQ